MRVTLPYIQGQSEAIRQALKKLDIQTCFTAATTLRQILSHPKDSVPSINRIEVVYRIMCANCNKSYVSKTERNLSQRRKEHMKAVETLSTDNCALTEHVLAEDHHIDWEEATVIGEHPFTNTHCVIESWYILTVSQEP